MAAYVVPILDEHLAGVGAFLHEHMNSKFSSETWRSSFLVPWQSGPNFGFMLVDSDENIVGVYTAIYSRRVFDGTALDVCNLATWCVLPEFRFQSLALLKTLLAQKGFEFTDLSPGPSVAQIMKRFDFESLDTGLVVQPNLPRISPTGAARLVYDAAAITATLPTSLRATYEDHRPLPGLGHVVIVDGQAVCYVVYRRGRRKGIPCATVLYSSDAALLSRHYFALGSFFLVHERALLTIYEARGLSVPPRLSRNVASKRTKLFRSDRLSARQIDNLYSEVVTLPT